MGKPEKADGYGRIDCGGIEVWVAPAIWEKVRPATEKILIAIEGYGRFWLHLTNR